MKIKNIIKKATIKLQNSCYRPQFEAQLLLCFYLKKDRIYLELNSDKELNNLENIKVTNEHQCHLGKWIDQHSSNKFAKSTEWSMFKTYHHKVHSLTQKFIEENSKNSNVDELKKISLEIEENIEKVFEFANKIKAINCKDIN